MDAPEAKRPPKAGERKVEAREGRLAQALRANLLRRKASDAPPTPQGVRDGQD